MPLMDHTLLICWTEESKDHPTLSLYKLETKGRMMKRKLLWCCLILVFVQMKTNAQQKTLSLQQAVETAITNNLDVKQSGLQQERAAVNLRQARANLLPTLNGSIDHTLNQGRSLDYNNSYINQQNTTAYYSVGSNLTLFNGLRILNNLRGNQY